MNESESESEVFPQTNWLVSEVPTIFSFEGLVEVEFDNGVVYCIIALDKGPVKGRYMGLSYIFERFFKGVEPNSANRLGNQYENITITIRQTHDNPTT